MKISNPSLYGAGQTSGGLLTTVNYVEHKISGVEQYIQTVSGNISENIEYVCGTLKQYVESSYDSLNTEIETICGSITEEIIDINTNINIIGTDLTDLSGQLFDSNLKNLKLNANIIPDIALNTVCVVEAVSGDTLTSESTLNINNYTPETDVTILINDWLSSYASNKDLDVGDIVIIKPGDSVESIIFEIKDLLGSWMITSSPESAITNESGTQNGYSAIKLYVTDSSIQSVDGEFPTANGNIPLTKLNNSINTINNNISTITNDVQNLNNDVDLLSDTLVGFDNTESGTVSAQLDNLRSNLEADLKTTEEFLSGVLNGFDNTTSGNVSAYISEIKTTTNFLSGVLSGFDNTTSGNVSAYIDNIAAYIADIVDDINTNSIKSQIVQFSTTLNDDNLTIKSTSGIPLVIENGLTITKPTEEETTGPTQSLLKKMFNTTNDVYKIVVQFHGEINVLKLLAKSEDKIFVEFYPDFQEVYGDIGKTYTQITVFLPKEAMELKETYLITWRVTYSRKSADVKTNSLI